MSSQNILDILAPYKKVLILTHEMPDGDCIGSALALQEALEQKGIYAKTVMKKAISEKFSFLSGSEEILLPDSLDSQVEAVIFVDCSEEERIGFDLKEHCPAVQLIINIDHHVSNKYFGDYNLVDSKAAATGEIVYKLVKDLKVSITPSMATALYTALVTDTGSFQYDNTTPETLKVAADLINLGANRELIRRYIWESNSVKDLEILKVALNSLTISEDNKIAYIYLNQETITSLEIDEDNFDGLINYPRSIADVEVALFFKEIEPQVVKVSFRSKEYVDVNKIAGLFGGGGHTKAAGCTLMCAMDEAIAKVLDAVKQTIVS